MAEVIDYRRLTGSGDQQTGLGWENMLEMMAAALAGFLLPLPERDDANFVLSKLSQSRTLRNESGAVRYELWIGPSGQVLDCTILNYTGTEAVADKVCELLKQRRLQAPHGPSQDSAYARSVMSTVFGSPRESKKLTQDLERLINPDRIISVSSSDSSIGENVHLLLAIDQNGHLTACKPAKEALIEKLASYCDQVRDEEFSIRSDQGQPVSYIRAYWIRLDARS